eukprot:NODE_3882_length_879_cov_15.465426_g3729_i0.p1 GENE.NODE_3882_length_879_cov_15.465426_g3729_i0~~NODE_3882_length_879_cov_15.465426_g3729_i0.p1  ORF type:complete len:281 (-),score=47.55 NODE_3882_length_879_cov_15.465426_g3729_i0:37-756(-)
MCKRTREARVEKVVQYWTRQEADHYLSMRQELVKEMQRGFALQAKSSAARVQTLPTPMSVKGNVVRELYWKHRLAYGQRLVKHQHRVDELEALKPNHTPPPPTHPHIEGTEPLTLTDLPGGTLAPLEFNARLFLLTAKAPRFRFAPSYAELTKAAKRHMDQSKEALKPMLPQLTLKPEAHMEAHPLNSSHLASSSRCHPKPKSASEAHTLEIDCNPTFANHAGHLLRHPTHQVHQRPPH